MCDKVKVKKKEAPTNKLEKEFHDFQKEWQKFLANDFHHVAVNVHTLVKQNNAIQQNMGKMEKNILTALGARAYNWVGEKIPEKK